MRQSLSANPAPAATVLRACQKHGRDAQVRKSLFTAPDMNATWSGPPRLPDCLSALHRGPQLAERQLAAEPAQVRADKAVAVVDADSAFSTSRSPS